MNKCIIGTQIFIRDKERVWACAEIVKEDDSKVIVKTEDDEFITLKPTDDFYLRNIDILNSSGLSVPSDLTQLTHLHEASVLHSLNVRFDIDEIYTFTGPILIAVNPFKNIKSLYSDSVLTKHIRPLKSKDPHIFATANNAYLGLCTSKKSQTILISGESGAGKTESTKYVMKFLACAGSDIKKRSLIESQVLESNPLLEAFGNAKTLRNDNSSRFGKYIELQFSVEDKNQTHGKLCGAKILTYLLEKVRVCDQQEGERNYHVFYQLCKAVEVARAQLLAKKKKQQLSLPTSHSNEETKKSKETINVEERVEEKGETVDKNVSENEEEECLYEFPMTKKFKEMENARKCILDFTKFKSHVYFRYLTKSSVCELDDIDEHEEFESTLYAMQTIGISEEEQYQVYKVLEGILYIGNILFNIDENKEEAKILDVSRNDLKNAAFLLDIDEKQLEDALCYKTIVANEESYKTPLNPDVANDIRDALSRAIYGCLFLKLVERTNESIGFVKDINLFCGVLDIFGFESFPLNSFEQLCINYTNECLQQFFNNFIFKCEEKLYVEEHIEWDPLDFPDNKDCVDILESKPTGIFAMLDEECLIPSGKDKTFCNKIINKHKNNRRFHIIRTDPTSFIIVHFAGQVKYTSLGFLEKNKDQLSNDAQSVLLNSTNKYISELFGKYLRRSSDRGRFVTVSSEFREQLNVLMQRIKNTEPHFIRCIKPNSQNVPDVFERISVNEQLKYGGVLQAVKVSRAGYPVRLSHKECVLDYGILLNKKEKDEFEKKCSAESWAEKATFILEKLYLRACVQEHVEELKKLKEKAKEYTQYETYVDAQRGGGKQKQQTEEKEKTETERNNIEKENISLDTKTDKNDSTSSNNITPATGDKIYDFNKKETSLVWSVGKTLCFFKSEAYTILSTMRSEFREQQAVIIQKNYKCYVQYNTYKLMKMKVLLLQKWCRHVLKIKQMEKLKKMQATNVICSALYAYHIRKQFLYKRKCATLIQSYVRRMVARKQYKALRMQYYASKIQATWKMYKERAHFMALKNATIRVQLRWKKILAVRTLMRLRMEEKEVGSLLVKNQTLLKELQEERGKTADVESKLLKAMATINKLTQKITHLEQVKKEQEIVIDRWKDQVTDGITVTNPVSYNTTQERNCISKNEGPIMHMIKEVSDLKGEDTEEIVRSKVSLKKILEVDKKTEKEIKKKKSVVKVDTKEYIEFLLNKIKKLEKENDEYAKKNANLKDRYANIVNILSQLKTANIIDTSASKRWGDKENYKFKQRDKDKYGSTIHGTASRYSSSTLLDRTNDEWKRSLRLHENHIDILIAGPGNVGKTSLLHDLFSRLGDEENLDLLKKNKRKEKQETGVYKYNKYQVVHKGVHLKIVDCGYIPDKNRTETFFNQIKNASCIIVVFDATVKESVKQAVQLLQEVALVNSKKTTTLYLLENTFNEKINMNNNKSDVTYAVHIAKTCNAYYVKTLHLHDILNEYTNKLKETLAQAHHLDNFNRDKRRKDNLYSFHKSKTTPVANNYTNYKVKINELIEKFQKNIDKTYYSINKKGYNNSSTSSSISSSSSIISSASSNMKKKIINNNNINKCNDGMENKKRTSKNGNCTIANKTSGLNMNISKSPINSMETVKMLKKDDGTSFVPTVSKKNNTVNFVVNKLKAMVGLQNKRTKRIHLLKESLPCNDYINRGNKKYNPHLGKGFQPVYEISSTDETTVTFLLIGKDTLNKDHTLLAVGYKTGVVFIYKIFKTKMEMDAEMEMEMDLKTSCNTEETTSVEGNDSESEKITPNENLHSKKKSTGAGTAEGKVGTGAGTGAGTGTGTGTGTVDTDASASVSKKHKGKLHTHKIENHLEGDTESKPASLRIQTNGKSVTAEKTVAVNTEKLSDILIEKMHMDKYGKQTNDVEQWNTLRVFYEGYKDCQQECVQLLCRLDKHKKSVTCIAFSLTEEKTITSSIDKTVIIWETATGNPLQVFTDVMPTLSVLFFSTNPNFFLCSNANSLLRLVNIKQKGMNQKIKVESDIHTLEMDNTGLYIFGGAKKGMIYVFEFIYNESIEVKLRSQFSSRAITCIKFVPRKSINKSACLLINTCDSHVGIINCLYDPNGVIINLSVVCRFTINHELLPLRSTYSSYGGGWFITGSEERDIYIFPLSSNQIKQYFILKYHNAPVMCVVVNERNTLMVSADTSGNVTFWRRFHVQRHTEHT